MPGLIKQFFVLMLVLLGFGVSLSIKCVSMNNQSRMVRLILIGLELVRLHVLKWKT